MLGLEFEVRPAGVNEYLREDESPEAHVERLARAKAREVAEVRPGALVLGGDTVVAVEERILGKPVDRAHAVEMLLGLQGRSHVVHSGLALAAPGESLVSGVSSTRVDVRALDSDLVRAYVETGEPLDKAGSYGIQGRGAAIVREVRGDYHAVVGLPVALLVQLLERSGWRYEFGRLTPFSGSAP